MTRLSMLAAALVTAAACIPGPRPTSTPIRQLRSGPPLERDIDGARCQVVILPGFGETPERLVEHGLVDLLRSEVDADVTVVDAHVGYYHEQSIVDRLHEDVIAPARRAGYDKVWIIAISLGTLGALGYGTAHAAELEGIVLIAPWLGDWGYGPYDLRSEIEDGGGYRAWRRRVAEELRLDGAAELEPVEPEAYYRHVVAWSVAGERPDGSSVPIHVGYARSDRYVRSQRLIAGAQPESRRLVAYGLHEFEVFYDIFRGLVWRGFLQRSCGRAVE